MVYVSFPLCCGGLARGGWKVQTPWTDNVLERRNFNLDIYIFSNQTNLYTSNRNPPKTLIYLFLLNSDRAIEYFYFGFILTLAPNQLLAVLVQPRVKKKITQEESFHQPVDYSELPAVWIQLGEFIFSTINQMQIKRQIAVMQGTRFKVWGWSSDGGSVMIRSGQ